MCKYCCTGLFSCCNGKKNKIDQVNGSTDFDDRESVENTPASDNFIASAPPIRQKAVNEDGIEIQETFVYQSLDKMILTPAQSVSPHIDLLFKITHINNYFYLTKSPNPNMKDDTEESDTNSNSVEFFSSSSSEPELIGKVLNKTSDKVGWKFCFSCQDNDLNIMWAIVQTKAIEYKLGYIKVLPPMATNRTPSKQITVYMNQNPDVKDETWRKIIVEIEKLLLLNKISPGNKPVANKAILGSLYISYRNDTHPDNPDKYISNASAASYAKSKRDKIEEAYNLVGAPDPFEAFDVTLKNDTDDDNGLKSESPILGRL